MITNLNEYYGIDERHDLDHADFFYPESLEEATLIYKALDEQYGWQSETARGRVFYSRQSAPMIAYDTEEGFIVIRDRVTGRASTWGFRVNFLVESYEAWAGLNQPSYIQCNEDGSIEPLTPTLIRDEVEDALNDLDERWYERMY